MTIASISDFREKARRKLPHFLFEYVDGGSYDEVTLRRNVDDLRDIALRQLVLRDGSSLDLSVELFGHKQALPVVLAPVGFGGLLARRGEIQAAHAANQAGVPFCLSTVSVCSVEEVAAHTEKPFWFQLYMTKDRGFNRDLIARAKAAGCTTLVFTVDLPVPGSRYRDTRSGMAAATGRVGQMKRLWQMMQSPQWAWDVGLMGRPHTFGNLASIVGKSNGLGDFVGWIGRNFDPSVTWADLDMIREAWDGPLVIKGILDPMDAIEAAELGADGIVVSNHGGRQLDGVHSSARALPAIADKVGDRLTILADGGIRSGLDVARMLALGAKGVMLGRAWAFALAAGGGKGVRHMLRLIESELRVAMILTGVNRAADINRDIIAR